MLTDPTYTNLFPPYTYLSKIGQYFHPGRHINCWNRDAAHQKNHVHLLPGSNDETIKVVNSDCWLTYAAFDFDDNPVII